MGPPQPPPTLRICTCCFEATLMFRLYISLSFGFSLAVNAWIFFRVSGGLFNPAVSLGMVLVGALTPLRGALLTLAQILGGITVHCSFHTSGLADAYRVPL